MPDQTPGAGEQADVMRDLKDPREALASVGLSQKEVKELANGNGSKEAKTKLRKLAKKVNGAPQWTRGRPFGRDHHGVAGAAVTLRDLALAAFVVAAFLYGQVDNGDRAQEGQGRLRH